MKDRHPLFFPWPSPSVSPGKTAPQDYEWEKWQCSSLDAALRKARIAPCSGIRIEVVLVQEVAGETGPRVRELES